MKRISYKNPFDRERAQAVSIRLRAPWEWYWTLDGVKQPSGTYSPSATQTVKRTKDVVTPGYAQRVAAGEIISHPYSMERRALSGGGNGDLVVTWSGSGHSNSFTVKGGAFSNAIGNFGSGSTPEIVAHDQLIRYEQTRALGGVQAATMQAGVAIGEFHHTMRMLVSPMRALKAAFERADAKYHNRIAQLGSRVDRVAKQRSALRKRKAYAMMRARENRKHGDFIRSIANYAPNISDAVLVVNLGIKPFLMDVEAILEKIPKLDYQERRTSRSTGSVSGSVTRNYATAQTYGDNKYHIDHKSKVTVRCSCLYADGFETSQHFGTRLSDLPETVWNIIPYSWLVDYALNINDYLAALRAQAYSRILAYSTVVDVEATAERVWDSVVPSLNSNLGVYGTVTQFNPGPSELLEFESRSRFTDSFGPNFVLNRGGTLHPPSQLQNVLALSTRWLSGKRFS